MRYEHLLKNHRSNYVLNYLFDGDAEAMSEMARRIAKTHSRPPQWVMDIVGQTGGWKDAQSWRVAR